MSVGALNASPVSKVLESLRGSVNAVIEQENDVAGESPVFEAARDIRLAIGNAFVAYEYPDWLKLLEDKVDAAVQRQFAELKSMVAALESRRSAEIVSLHSRVQLFINSLPLADWQPKLTGVAPRCVPIIGGAYKISFLGCFQYAGSTMSATFVLDECRLIAALPTREDCLSFIAPYPLGCFPKLSYEKWHTMKGKLEVEYCVGGWFNPYRKAVYEIDVRIFPLGPGPMTVTYPKIVESVVERLYKSLTFIISSQDFAPGQPKEREMVILPSKGWKISGSPRVILHKEADCKACVRYSQDQVSLRFCLLEDEERAEAHVEFTEAQTERVEKEHTEQVKLKWGGYVGFESPTIRAELECFNGQKYQLIGSDETNPYLRIIRLKDQFLLIATSP